MKSFPNLNRARFSARVLLSMLALVLLLGGCTRKGDAADSATASKDKATAEAPEQNAVSEKDAPRADIYPGMNFGALNPGQRVKFVEIAQSEVCPCPDATESLHECLQAPQKACSLAKQVAGQVAMRVQQGFSKTDILDAVAKYVENTRKVHQFDLRNTPHKGPTDAPVQVVEFADFQCPYCRIASGLLGDISRKYGDKVVIYFKQFPLSGHEQGMPAAVASLAAKNQDKFWQMHDLLFENQSSLNNGSYEKFADRLGLNAAKFKADLQSPMIAAQIQGDRQEGENAGLTGTPTIFINGRLYMGGIDAAALTNAIEQQLAEGAAPAEAAPAEAGGEPAAP